MTKKRLERKKDMKKKKELKVIVVNPPTKEQKEQMLKEIGRKLSIIYSK